jgi:hypothetical protein
MDHDDPRLTDYEVFGRAKTWPLYPLWAIGLNLRMAIRPTGPVARSLRAGKLRRFRLARLMDFGLLLLVYAWVAVGIGLIYSSAPVLEVVSLAKVGEMLLIVPGMSFLVWGMGWLVSIDADGADTAWYAEYRHLFMIPAAIGSAVLVTAWYGMLVKFLGNGIPAVLMTVLCLIVVIHGMTKRTL